MQEVISTRSAARTTSPSARISGMGAKLSLGAAAVFLILLAAVHFIKPEFEPSWHFISEYSIGSSGWIMQLAFLSLALSLAALVFAIRSQVTTAGGKLGLALALVVVVAMAAAAFFTIDPITAAPEELTTYGSLHGLATLVGNPGFAIAAVLISVSLVRNPAWASSRRVILWTGNLPWMSLVLMFAVLGITLSQAGSFGPDVVIGWPNRLLVVTYCLWIMTVARQALQLSSQRS